MGIEAIIGAVLPVLIELIAKYVKNTTGKFIVSLAVPLLIGIALNWKALSVADVETIIGSGAVIFASAQIVYKTYFKDSALQRKIEKI